MIGPELTDEELVALTDEYDRLAVLESPADFAQVVTRREAEKWLPYRHLMLLNEKLLAISRGEIKRLIVTMPPRHGKSEMCSKYFPAWFLNRYPERRVILCSYGDDFAAEWGRKVRDLIRTHTDYLSISINEASKAADRWDLEGHRGGMKTAGVGGQITGRGAHLLIIDDPVKDAEEANSATIREKKWDWWRTTARTRLEPGGAIIIIQTRWHEDDLTGRILKDQDDDDPWEIINLPAFAEEGDPLGRTPGTALCPERYDENALAAIKNEIGSQAWSALYQQRPAPEGGGFFKRENFRYWRPQAAEQKTYVLEDDDGSLLVPQSECWRFVTMDLASSTRNYADYTVAAVWDVAPYLEPTRLILVHVIRERIEGAGHVDLGERLWRQYRPSFVGVEEAQQGSQTLAFLRRQGVLIRPLKHKNKDKVFRARDAALLTENHRAYFPKRAQWLTEWEHELLLFPTGTHDDQVDAFSYAAQEILRGMNLHKKAKAPYTVPTLEERVQKYINGRDKPGVVDHPVLGRLS